MKIVHNANAQVKVTKEPAQKASTWAQRARYKAYKKSLKKYAVEIKEIQEYWPGWLPEYLP